MGIACNGQMVFARGVKAFGATAFNSSYNTVLHGNASQTNRIRNLTAGEGITSELVGLPSGYRHPAAWMMPQKGGALAAHKTIRGAGAASISMVGGVNGIATLSGSGSLTGTGALIISMVAALSGSGTISSASANAYLNLAAQLAGSGDMAGAVGAIAHATAALAGEGDINGTINALGTLAAAIVVTGSGLTTSNVGQAVWAAVASANNEPGSMGEKLNDAGSASNPWTEDLSGAQTSGTAGWMLKIIQQILRNKTVTDPATGVMTVYDDDDVTPLFTADLSKDVAGTLPYDGTEGAERRDRLT